MGDDVADISPGTVLVAGSTGWRYRVLAVSDDDVVARGPRGTLRVGRRELQRDIARGRVGVE